MDGAEEEFLFELRLEPQVKERRPPKVLYNNLYENGFKEKRQLINIKWGKKKSKAGMLQLLPVDEGS